ncbi:23S rRNA (guanosine(2251)-2'-O)-methyltransferase RlmB [Vagococcus coleopterorum]|uniref:23S rRNA (Guanosine(2251)-2'-O)-methyltransferase RlmB n=1 Tax=Vagococcus coleopterorum TaxID=2714946 RepID=A0A6G8AM15_9ENTE|nr:23S rRNA (guanosine(2251)-2'-O)-methyltransferase RlmB [Vagococcus coleopterorum]QIL46124.1 23S rRNA (guanosine(2251)-2'-O)-methyltransferase RlmB [Vagococcus coleopterorum]
MAKEFKGNNKGKRNKFNDKGFSKSSKRPQVEDLSAGSTEEVDFVYGKHAVVESLKNKRGNKLFLQEDLKGANAQELKELAAEYSVPVSWAPKVKLDKLTDGAVHQGIVMGITPFEYLSVEELIEQAKSKKEEPFFLVLDGIEDPHNFGSILRTADATGVDGVIIPKHRAVGITSVVTKTSTGAVEHIPVARATNLKQGLVTLKENGFWIFGTDMSGTDYRQWNTAGSIALIIGNEGKGMSPGLKKDVDEMLSIPMSGHVQSLNASVAAGLLMYEVFRNRTK